MYWINRAALKFICKLLGQQCSGKRKSGFAVEWCKFRAFHDGACETWAGDVFTDGKDDPNADR